MYIVLILFIVLVSVNAFVAPKSKNLYVASPLYENFGFDFAEDQYENSPAQLFGEANYKRFVGGYDQEALLLGGKKYNIIERIRALKLLSATADSGLLEVLEKKGLTLTQVEKLLPLIDNLDILPLTLKNKDTILSLAPLLIEPAPSLIPLAVGVLSNPALVGLPGALLVVLGGYNIYEGNTLGAIPALLGLPLVAIASVLGQSISVPTVAPKASPVASFTNEPSIKISVSSAPKVVSPNKIGGTNNGKRRTIKINKY